MDDVNSKSKILKEAILSKYRSIRQFAAVMNMPYSTLVTALDRGIEGMAYNTVIRMCDILSLNPVDFSPLDESDALSAQIMTKKVMEKYQRFNKAGRRRILEIMDDYSMIPAYTLDESKIEEQEETR